MLFLERHCHISTHTQIITTTHAIKYIVVLVFTRSIRATSPQTCKPGRVSHAIADHHVGEMHPTNHNKVLDPRSSVLLLITLPLPPSTSFNHAAHHGPHDLLQHEKNTTLAEPAGNACRIMQTDPRDPPHWDRDHQRDHPQECQEQQAHQARRQAHPELPRPCAGGGAGSSAVALGAASG